MTLIPRDTAGWWRYANPLAGLTLRQAQSIYDSARRGCSPLLHRVYDAIEAADPLVMTCVERRSSALAGLGWRVTARAGADKALADEQRDAASELADGIGDLAEAVEHLDLAFFRGFSIVQPVWEGGRVRRVVRLDSWNFMRAPDGAWLWNPDCRESGEGLEALGPDARLVAVSRPRAIDYPAMGIHIRKALGERDWGRFVERYGIPPVDAVMGAGATEEQRGDYLRSAEAARDGRSVVWPAGTTVSRAEGARGQDPFTAFVEHQEKLVVLMATGGTLTSLAQADTGSLAGGAQMDVWEQIVQRDGVAISGALHRGLFVPFLRRAFPGRPALARLVLGRETEPTAGEAADLAGKLRAAGYRVDQSQLEEATGFKLEREEPQPQPGFGGFGGFANKAAPQDPDSVVAKPLQNARRAGGATDAPRDPETRSDAILRDFAADMGPAAEKIKSLLDALDAGRDVRDEARKLADELPDLMADDPAMAAVIEEAMADAFAGAAGGGEETVQNKEGECRAQDPAHCPVHGTPETKADGETKKEKTLRDKAAEVKPERVAKIAAGEVKDYVTPEEGLAVVLSDPTIKSADGRELKFDQSILAKYGSGQGRSMNQADEDRFKLVQAAIYAVRHDGDPRVVIGRKDITGTAYPPRGSQRLYRADVGGGKTVWVFTWADKIYIRSIQERDKNNPPYD